MSLKQVDAAAFSGCKKLKHIVIEGTPQLAEYAFAHLSGLQTVKVNSKIPPRADITTFYGIHRSQCKLIVPKGSEKAYRKAPGWSLFFADMKQAKETCDPMKCLIPVPMDLQVKKDARLLQVHGNWNIVAADGLANEKEQAERILSERGCLINNNTQVGNSRQKANVKGGSKEQLTLTMEINPSLAGDEAYTLEVLQRGVTIKGKTAAGVFYGLMTFDQLLRGNGAKNCCDAIPLLSLSDQPRTHVRELMVDPCRTFIPYEQLKAFIPEMARYKLNAIHLHLVDDQAWRIEIKKYPRLTAEASSRWGMDDMNCLSKAIIRKSRCGIW